ncbi:MAG TPA: HAMP domain-containing protein, partial [Acidimicrobiia bacterium]|nr:HAMP domain-containing protein [Acidimicrobiia bacterium]
SLLDGPYAGSTLASTIMNGLASVPVGDTILVDLEPYFPGGGHPIMFAAAAVRDDAEVIGAVAVALPPAFVDDLTTFGGQWSDIGLGKSGEIYLVGPDHLMRSVSRFWVENPDEYAKTVAEQGYPSEVLDAINRYGSTVLAQPVDTEAVESALEDRSYSGTADNYLGVKTRTDSDSLDLPGLHWVIVAGFSASDASRPIKDYLWSLGLIALILAPIVAFLGVFMARRMTRPIRPLTDAVARITDGDLDAEVPDQGRNEYGDFGNRINTLTKMLRERDEQRNATDQAIRDVLLAAMPERLVVAARAAVQERGEDTPAAIGDLMDTCTLVSISVSDYFDLNTSETEQTVETSIALARDLENLAEGLGIERVRSAPEEYLFAAGLESPGFDVQAAGRFVAAVRRRLGDLSDETGLDGTYRIGLSAGHVVAGLQSGNQLSFGIWGRPVRTALALAGLAKANQALADAAVAAELGDSFDVEPVHLVDLSGATVEAFALIAETSDSGDQ